MSQYFESIRIQHRQIHLLPYHTARLNRTRKSIFGIEKPLPLDIKLPSHLGNGKWKCRVSYNRNIEQITFDPYPGRAIKSFKLIDGGSDINYSHKGDRTALQALYEQREDHDDIIILRDEYLTDSYWSNLLFSQHNRWYTPATPLLRGTMRQYLLDSGIITERIIRRRDIGNYSMIMPINALNPFDPAKAISTAAIF